MIEWLVDFNGMSTRLGLIYAQKMYVCIYSFV